jgi:hypothetical protein
MEKLSPHAEKRQSCAQTEPAIPLEVFIAWRIRSDFW